MRRFPTAANGPLTLEHTQTPEGDGLLALARPKAATAGTSLHLPAQAVWGTRGGGGWN